MRHHRQIDILRFRPGCNCAGYGVRNETNMT